MDPLLLATVAASSLLQLTAAAQALRLIKLTGRYRAWALVALALIFMAVRRMLVLKGLLLDQGTAEQTSLMEEWVALVTSAFMLMGIAFMGPMFRSINGSQQALRESEEKYRAVVENANEAVFILQEGRIRYQNPAASQITGYSQGELADLPVHQLFHPEDAQRARQAYEQALAGQPVAVGRLLRGRGKAGQPLWVAVNAAPMTWEGRPAVLGLARDLTEQKRLEHQLLHAQKMEALGRLAGGVAHEFNNLLTIINGYSELALRMVNGNAHLRSKLEAIRAAGHRSTVFTRQLLTFSRWPAQARRRLDLNEVIGDLASILEPLLGERVRIKKILEPGLWPITGERGQMEQVIMNLIVNARDAMPQGGKVAMETRNLHLAGRASLPNLDLEPGDYVLLAISDTGCGMDQELLSHVFEPFFTTKGKGEGTGLGLSTVYGIVNQSRGGIAVFSEPGKGTAFEIYLPRGADQAEAPADQAGQDEPEEPGFETILLVEDEDGVRALLAESLEMSGYQVLQARDGQEALTLIRGHAGPIHLVVSDVVMPNLNGPQLARQLGALRPEVRVLLMSGYADLAPHYQEGLGQETPIIHKPFTMDQLEGRIRGMLRVNKILS